MRLRSLHDAVLTTGATSEADNCRLTVRDWDGNHCTGVNHSIMFPPHVSRFEHRTDGSKGALPAPSSTSMNGAVSTLATGRQPKAVLLDRSRRVKADAPLFSPDNREVIVIDDVDYKGITSLTIRQFKITL